MHKEEYFMRKNKRLERIVMAALMAGSLSVCPSVFAGMPDDDDPIRGKATVEEYIFDGKPFMTAHIYTKGYVPTDPEEEIPDSERVALRTFGKGEKAAFKQGLKYWAEVLPAPATQPLVNVYLQKLYDNNAGAGSPPDGDLTSLAKCFQESFTKDQENPIDAVIVVNLGEKGTNWSYSGFGVLPANGYNPDYQGTIIHEMFHALGIATNIECTFEDGKEVAIDTEGEEFTRYEKHLYDFRGTPLTECSKVALIGDIKEAKDDKTFYILKTTDAYETEERYGGVYFKGQHVDEVLTINGQMANLAWPDGSDVPAVAGLPINSYESAGKEAELSHFELQNSLQSHQLYRNWCIPMEAELAAMQDLGYTIDRRRFYGNSIYNSDMTYVNNNPFFAREGGKYVEGKASEQSLALGFHIYGSNNTITQAADLLADGELSMGIRVDGVGNKLTVAEGVQVTANGKNGRGINFAYGKDHELTVAGTVTATGEGGRALAFDFGDNELGNRDEYRGSYIGVEYDDGEIDNTARVDAVQGALVNKVDISGQVEGNKAAIYIAPSALVQNINIQTGAELKGDIISDWSPKYALNIMGEGENLYEENIRLPEGEDGFTRLNFAGDKLDYDGNINSDLYNFATVVLNVNSGVLNYGGTAEIDSVNVEKDAILQGGSFKLDTEGLHVREGVDKDDSGMLTNKGMISAALPNGEATKLTIEGNVNNDGGTFGFIADGENVGTIEITGGDVYGDAVVAVNPNGIYLPGDEYTIGELVTVDGSAIVYTDAINYKSGMLTGVFDEEISTLTFAAENNLNSSEAAVNAAFEEMDNLAQAVGEGNDKAAKQQLMQLFNMEGQQAANTLKAIKGQQGANIAAVMQQNNLVHRSLGMRLSQINRAKTVNMNVPVKQLTEGEAIAVPMKVTLQPEYSMWAKINRNKGAINAASDYKTVAYTIGWDKQVSKDWRFGFLGSYAKGKFEAETILNDVEDYRLGVYGGYNKGAGEALVYADYGWGRNKLNRGLSSLGLNTRSKYDSNIMELGAEYKYDLQHKNNKTWHVAPYGALQINRYSQDSYKENGADPYNKTVDKLNNTYVGFEAGVDLERRLKNGNAYGMRLGYKRGLTGVEPKQNYHYAADPAHRYTNYGDADKNKLILNLNGEVQMAPNWSISGEAGYERGKKGHGYSGEIMLKHTW